MKRLTCKGAFELISRQHEHPLAAGEKLWLNLHLYICTGCRNFRNNARVMRAALKRYLERGNDQ